MFGISVIGSIVLAAYSLLGAPPVEDIPGPRRLLSLITVPPLVFAALWYLGNAQAQILIWLIVGDEGPLTHWLDYSREIACVCALLVTTVVFVRITFGWTGRQFAAVETSLAVGLLALGACMAYREYIEPIEGDTAIEAAQNILAELIEAMPIGDSTKTLTLREEYPKRRWGYGNGNKSFIAYRDEDPVIQIVVAPYEGRWWRFGFSERLDPPDDRLRKIEETIKVDPATADREYRQMLRSYPNAESMVRVREMKEEIGLRVNGISQ